MNILSEKYFIHYRSQLQISLDDELDRISRHDITGQSFTFYTSVAVMSSSRIEGEQMEVDSYVKHKMQHIEYMPELTEKPNDLYRAYLFAKEHKLTVENLMHAHKILSEHLLPEKWRGAYRKNEMVIMEHATGKIQFEAAPFQIIEEEMDKLLQDIDELKNKKLTAGEVFYYASFIHVAFVNIHPFNDGNGRAGRLLEKWFLSEHLGHKAWFIRSEEYYYKHVNDYYLNLNRLGMFYEEVNYEKATPFLLMLAEAVKSDADK